MAKTDEYLTPDEARREVQATVWRWQQIIENAKRRFTADPDLAPIAEHAVRLLDDVSHDLALLADVDPRAGGLEARFDEIRDQLRVLVGAPDEPTGSR